MVGAAAAVLSRRAPELGDDHDDRLSPGFAQTALQLQKAAGELSQQLLQPTLLGEMGVPALRLQHRYPRAVRPREQIGRRPRRLDVDLLATGLARHVGHGNRRLGAATGRRGARPRTADRPGTPPSCGRGSLRRRRAGVLSDQLRTCAGPCRINGTLGPKARPSRRSPPLSPRIARLSQPSCAP